MRSSLQPVELRKYKKYNRISQITNMWVYMDIYLVRKTFGTAILNTGIVILLNLLGNTV